MATLFVVYIPTGTGESGGDAHSSNHKNDNKDSDSFIKENSSTQEELIEDKLVSPDTNQVNTTENHENDLDNDNFSKSNENASLVYNDGHIPESDEQNDCLHVDSSETELIPKATPERRESSVDKLEQDDKANIQEVHTKQGHKAKKELLLDISKAATSPEEELAPELQDTEPLIGDSDDPGRTNAALVRDKSGNSLANDKVNFEMGAEDEQEMTTEHISLEQLLQAILENLGIEKDIWVKTDDEEHFQVSFLVENRQIDDVLQSLTRHGIGRMDNTSVSLFPSDYHMIGQDKTVESESSDRLSAFMESIKSKLTVAQVVDAVKANAILTFDYVLLIILASLIAAMGLAENSSVVLVASMLVSPLMGPIMGGTFGVSVRNRELIRLGLKNETIGLTICIVIGFLCGLIMSAVNHDGANWGATDAWPTSEMQSRGLLRSLWVGILIAIPSGAGVALSILGGNAGSLVGVAISASLLPPAVNAGMLWAYAIVSAIDHPEFVTPPLEYTTQVPLNFNETDNATSSNDVPVQKTHEFAPPNCLKLVDNEYEFVYRCDMAQEAAILGSVSLLLTLLNIICIIFMGIVILKLKEVVPRTALSTYLDNFWKTDIKVARDTYKTMKASDSAATDLAKLAKQIATQDEDEGNDMDAIFAKDLNSAHLSLENDPKYRTIVGRLPNTPVLPISQIAFQFDQAETIHSWSHLRGSPTSPTSPRVVNPFHNMDLRSRLNKAKSVDLPSVRQRPVRVIQDAEQQQHHHRARRSYYRQESAPAQFDEFTVDPSQMKQSTSKGRFMITTVPAKAGTTTNTSPRPSRVTFRVDSYGTTPV